MNTIKLIVHFQITEDSTTHVSSILITVNIYLVGARSFTHKISIFGDDYKLNPHLSIRNIIYTMLLNSDIYFWWYQPIYIILMYHFIMTNSCWLALDWCQGIFVLTLKTLEYLFIVNQLEI